MHYIKYIKFLITTSLLLIFSCVYSQQCRGFHKTSYCSIKTEKGFNLYGQSRSALLETDSTYTYKLILYGQKDYVLSFCTENTDKLINYKILDKETNSIMYDNQEDDYIESVGFTIDSPQEIIIKIKLLNNDSDISDFSENRACVGILILWRKVSRLGF